VCLDTRVLHPSLEGRIHARHTDIKGTVPVVRTRDAIAALIVPPEGPPQLVATLRFLRERRAHREQAVCLRMPVLPWVARQV
jgi:hypothetical protein